MILPPSHPRRVVLNDEVHARPYQTLQAPQRAYQRVKRGMSMKMQAPSVFRELPVRQNVHIALQHHVPQARLFPENLVKRVAKAP